MKKTPAQKAPRPQDFVWSRAGLTLKVCPVPKHPEGAYCVVLQDKDGGLLVNVGSAASCIEHFKRLAWMIGEAMNRNTETMMRALGTLPKGDAKTFDDVIQAMLCHPNGRKVLCTPRRPCRACREK